MNNETDIRKIKKVGQVWRADEVASLEMDFFSDINVVAGFPIPLSNDERAKKIDVLRMLCPHPDATYLIRVEGDSMIDSNICSGDILVVDKSNRNPSENEVAMCEVNGEYTVKFVRRHDGKSWLVPANKNYPEIEINDGDEFNVWGVVTFVIHQPQSV
ncbi:MAG: translesion error-prone DNA polymerase V autoproteolytic subunit [Bacteroidales bacterium]|nr:translesion error-prone DNA polymerase V autoproteolytic subunit [Candidatus Liminaster caballi]